MKVPIAKKRRPPNDRSKMSERFQEQMRNNNIDDIPSEAAKGIARDPVPIHILTMLKIACENEDLEPSFVTFSSIGID